MFLCHICGDDVSSTESWNQVTLKCNPNHTFCYTCIYEWYAKIKDQKSYNTNEAQKISCPICRKIGGYLKCPPNVLEVENIHIPSRLTRLYHHHVFCGCLSEDGDTCDSRSLYQLYMNPTLTLHMCSYHYQRFYKGNDIYYQDGKVYESIYKKYDCVALTSTQNQCSGNANPHKDGNLILIEKNGTKYCVCKKHKDDYEKNKVLSIKDHDKTTQIQKQEEEQEEEACGTLMKSGSYCKKKAKAIYGGKCALHKQKKDALISPTVPVIPVIPAVPAPLPPNEEELNININVEEELELFWQMLDLEDEIKKEDEKIQLLQLNLEFLKKEAQEKRTKLNSIFDSNPMKKKYFHELFEDSIQKGKSE